MDIDLEALKLFPRIVKQVLRKPMRFAESGGLVSGPPQHFGQRQAGAGVYAVELRLTWGEQG